MFCQNQESNRSQGCPPRSQRLWEQRSCGEITPMQRCECCLLTLISRPLCTKKSFMWGNWYEIWLQNTGLRKDLKRAVTKSKFSALFHLECSNKGCVIIPKSTKSVFDLKCQCLNFAEFQTKIKIKAVTILESRNPAKPPEVLCKNH